MFLGVASCCLHKQILLLVYSKYKIVSNLFESIPKMLRTRGESPVGVGVHTKTESKQHICPENQ